MVYNYFPGCTLKEKAKDLDKWGRDCAEALGVPLTEIPDWQCCGGEYPLSKDEIAIRLSSVRALMYARDNGGTLVTLCSACHNVLKQTNYDIVEDENFSLKVNNYMAQEHLEYHGETKVLHYLELLRDVVGFDNVKKAVKKPLTGQKIGAYYGCLLLRPGKKMAMDNPENPRIMEDMLAAIGATPVVYAQRNECCGGYLALEDSSLPEKRVTRILENAKAQGADTVITACPLCYYNLRKYSGNIGVDVRYLTDVLAEALDVKKEA
ncbi:MAG: CoB--CoM heterodisulfide reductase iron-sulfur subunit B family protein [Lachnospiraceae bacterium]|jgi:heterodisulfide reductase subunit B